MTFSKLTTILLFGIIAFNGSALAKGTKSGIKVNLKSTIEYRMDGKKLMNGLLILNI